MGFGGSDGGEVDGEGRDLAGQSHHRQQLREQAEVARRLDLGVDALPRAGPLDERTISAQSPVSCSSGEAAGVREKRTVSVKATVQCTSTPPGPSASS